jgi:hypothetical protein
MNQLSKEELFRYHKRTGCPLLEARTLLENMEPTLFLRVVEATLRPAGELYRLLDPIEFAEDTRDIVSTARARAVALVSQRQGQRMGFCHAVWDEQTRILKAEYGLIWFSPQKMNPHTYFD